MKTIFALAALVVVSIAGALQLMRPSSAQGTQMTHQELFSGTRAALEQVEFLRWTPCSIDADYRYGVCFVREEGRGAQELNTILPELLKARGISFSSIETMMNVSGGTAFVPGLDHSVGISFNEFEVSATLSGPGGLMRDDPTLPAWGNFAMKRLGDASKDIAARLLGSRAALEGRVDCTPSSSDAYCVTTQLSERQLLQSIARKFYFTAREQIEAAYDKGSFDFSRKDEQYNFYHVKISYVRKGGADEYTLFDGDYKRKNFKITYSSNPSDKSTVRVEASWLDGYTPPPEK